MDYYEYFKNYITNEIDLFENKLSKYKTYIDLNKIDFSDTLIEFIDTKILLTKKQLNHFNKESGFKNEILFRTLLQELSLLNIEFDYRSRSYQESTYSNTFNLDNFSLNDINYNRYSSKYIKKIENYLLDLYSLENSYKCLITSSGMSAYSVIEGLILRNLYKEGEEIFIPAYIYFEAFEQINKLNNIGLKIKYGKDNNYTENEILDYIKINKPKYVFLDEINNTSNIGFLDIDYILNDLNNNYNSDITIIIDITMSGLENNFKNYNNLDLIIYGSASKYLFNGLDISMMGFIFVKDKFYSLTERQRRNIGAILYDFQALTFPLLGKDFYNNRLSSITSDALKFVHSLKNDIDISEKYNIYYLGDSLSKLGRTFYGSIVTINFKEYSLRNKGEYKKIINSIIEKSKIKNIPIIEGVSFGFSITRISASDVMSKGEPPFLRISIGPNYYNDIDGLIDIFKEVLINFNI